MSNTAKKISEFEKLVEPAQADEKGIYWFVARANVLKGPFTQRELHEKVNAGEISAFDYGWRQGFQEWRPLGSLPETSAGAENATFSSYPSLPVPGAGSHHGKERSEDALHPSRKRKDVEVRLRTTRRHFFSPRQGVVTVLFALLVSYITNHWALKQVHHNVSTFFQNRATGRTLHLGEESSGIPHAEVWAPLYSAPAYLEMKNQLKLPARVYGIPHYNQGALKLGEQKIDAHAVTVEEELSFSELDPIFVRPVEISGQLNPKRPTTLRVKQLGEPFLENAWEN